MSEKITTRAIILSRVAYGDSDWIVHFFSRDLGRMSGIAKSARKSVKRFGSGLEPGAVVHVTYNTKSNSNLVRLEESRVVFSTTGMMKTLVRIEALAKALKLAVAFLREHQTAIDKFDLMESYLRYISETDPKLTTRIAFELKWLAFAGFEPSLENCVSCGVPVVGDCIFSIVQGGVLCTSCKQSDRGSLTLSRDVRLLMDKILHEPIGSEFKCNDYSQISSLLDNYSEYILGHSLGRWQALS